MKTEGRTRVRSLSRLCLQQTIQHAAVFSVYWVQQTGVEGTSGQMNGDWFCLQTRAAYAARVEERLWAPTACATRECRQRSERRRGGTGEVLWPCRRGLRA